MYKTCNLRLTTANLRLLTSDFQFPLAKHDSAQQHLKGWFSNQAVFASDVASGLSCGDASGASGSILWSGWIDKTSGRALSRWLGKPQRRYGVVRFNSRFNSTSLEYWAPPAAVEAAVVRLPPSPFLLLSVPPLLPSPHYNPSLPPFSSLSLPSFTTFFHSPHFLFSLIPSFIFFTSFV
jgi:hypothetical protein